MFLNFFSHSKLQNLHFASFFIQSLKHINALLFEGFDVWVDENESSLLRFDKLKKPTLQPKHWEAVVKMNGLPRLEKFEFEERILAKVG